MTKTDEILADAKKLGKKIKDHEIAQKLENAIHALEQDIDAQRLMTDYNRLTTEIAEKEHKGQPVEVDEKHKIAELHKQIVMNQVLQDLQMTQMDYSDLMRQVDQAISSEIAPPQPNPESKPKPDEPKGESPIIQ
ncbi:hypothetical protein KS4_34610 [Poriferisphaera corsica]|uniref:Uncharacterized protein n=1 Tax=Poriferisphaera corsica TaxID=2528020 RepID=A0A517YYS1_9BACT|nr:YlbF family regulator [Poriferisphaera corsica]QDU35380.1 hypothetical protein KS4_34610 [Poriferisphaera corsica]